MTISSSVRTAGPYAGTGTSGPFAFSFKVFQPSDVQVIQTDASGNNTVLVLTTNYTVALNADQNANPGGSVTLVGVLPTGYQLRITSQVFQLQSTSITNNGGFYPKVIENSLDYLTILVQQLQATLNLCAQFPPNAQGTSISTQLPYPQASKLLGWDATGTFLTNTSPSGVGAGSITGGGSGGSIASGTITDYNVAPGAAVQASKLAFLAAITGAVPRTGQSKWSDFVSVKDFGAVGDGVNDDTNAFVLATTAGGCIRVPAGNYKITSEVLINVANCEICGESLNSTRIFASGNFNSLFRTGTSSSGVSFKNIKFDAGATTTECLSLTDGVNNRVFDCEFTGTNGAGTAPLIRITSSYNKFEHCKFSPVNAALWSIWIDNRADGALVITNTLDSCNFGYTGKGVWIKQSNGAQPRCEGTKLTGCDVICTGSPQLQVDSHYGLELIGNAFEESLGNAVYLNGNDRCHIIGGSIGLGSGVTTQPCLRILPTNGKATIVSGVTFRAGNYGVRVEAGVSAQVSDITIMGCTFDTHAGSSLFLDSVIGCTVSGCVETGTAPASGSISTQNTFGHGTYIFEANKWTGALAPVWDTGSTYLGRDNLSGPTLANAGQVTVGTSSTSTVVNHGLVSAPTKVTATAINFPTGAYYISSINASTFTINWASSTTCIWDWEARV